MDKIKKFFEKKKTDTKFKLAGEGHRLNEPSHRGIDGGKPSSSASISQNRSDAALSQAQQAAAAAAMARLEKKKEPTPQQRSAAVIRAQALKEIEQEQQVASQATAISKDQPLIPAQLAVSGVFYKCPLIGPEVLPKKEIEQRIKEFLYEQLNDEEAGLTACLVIHTVNKNPEKVQHCIETLFRYLDNVVQHPQDEKYQKIRLNNKVYQDKVAPIEGSQQFLRAAGFQLQQMPNPQGELEDFWLYADQRPERIDFLSSLRDGLVSAEPIRPELDRGLQVLLPSQAAQRVELPSDFFWLTPEELKREQQLKTEAVERNLMLRTKAMRVRDEQAQQRKYRFTLVRIKFPDGPILQGTFKINETFQAVRLFVQEALQDAGLEFNLLSPSLVVPTGEDIEQATLVSLNLVPSAVLHFKSPAHVANGYLRDELMVLMQPA